MKRALFHIAITFVACCIAAYSGAMFGGAMFGPHSGAQSVCQQIATVSLSRNSIPANLTAGATVGTIAVAMSPASPAFGGTLSLVGTDAAKFALSGATLITAQSLGAGTYNISIIVTAPGIVNSPFAQPETITAVAPQLVASLNLSNNSIPLGQTTVGTITLTMNPLTPAFSGTLSITGANASNFVLSGSSLQTNGALSIGNYNINLVATETGVGNSPFVQPETITITPQSVLPVNRDASANWRMAGLQSIGGIPNRTTQCGSTLTPSGSDDTAAIQAAINACPAGDFVLLGSGTFIVNEGSTVTVNKGVTLRGGGPGTTIVQHPPGKNWYGIASISGNAMTILPASSTNTQGTLTTGVTLIGANGTSLPANVTVASGSGSNWTLTNCGSCSITGNTTVNVAVQTGNWGATIFSAFSGLTPSVVVTLGSGVPTSSTTTLTANGVQGASTVTVASTSGISVGSLIEIDELGIAQSMPDIFFNNGLSNACGTNLGCVWAEPNYQVTWSDYNPSVFGFMYAGCLNFTNNFQANCGGTGSDVDAYSLRPGGVTAEYHLVTAINGNTLTFDSPLMMPYRTANTAEVIAWTPASITQQAGLEQLTVQYGDNGNIQFQGCVYCWAKNVESTHWLSGGAFGFFQASMRNQIEEYWAHDAAWPVPGGGGYSLNQTYGTSENYIVNGISMVANKVAVVRASGAGTVFAYNYMDDGYIDDASTPWVETGANCSHLVGSHHTLWEGNQVFNVDSDTTHGNATHCTYFRNWATGFRNPFEPVGATLAVPNGNSLTWLDDAAVLSGFKRALSDHPYAWWDSFVGNVAGMPGQVSTWTQFSQTGSPTLYRFGFNDASVTGAGEDPVMLTFYPGTPSGADAPGCVLNGDNCTTVLDGNFDFKSDAIQWASNDSAHVLPNSLYLSAKPSWWPANYPWPWVTPEVTGTPIKPGPSTGTCSAPVYDAANSSFTAPGTVAAGATVTWTLPHAIPPGETAIVTVWGSPGNNFQNGAAQITDNASGTHNSYRMTGQGAANPSGTFPYWGMSFIALNVQGSPTQLFINLPAITGGDQFVNVLMDLFTNVNVIDGSGGNIQLAPGTGTDAATSGTFPTLISGDLIYGAVSSGTSTVASGTGFTTAQSNSGATLYSEYKTAGAAGTPAATFTDATNGGGNHDFGTIGVALNCTHVLAGLPAKARFDTGTPFAQPNGQAISGVNLANNSIAIYPPPAAGSVIGAVSVTMSPATPPFSGTLSVTGTDASHFSISGGNLVTNDVLTKTSYSINIVATQAGVSGSPFTQAETITGTVPTAFYLAASGGSDSNPGTIAQPFATFGKCQTAMQGSGTKLCFVRSGTYALPAGGVTLGSSDNNEIWAYYPPDGVQTAVLDGTSVGTSAFMFTADVPTGVTINGLKFIHLPGYPSGAIRVGGNNSIIRNNLIDNAGADTYIGMYVDGGTNQLISSNTVQNLGFTGTTCSGSPCARGIGLFNVTNSLFANNAVNCVIHFGIDGQFGGSLSQNIFYNNSVFHTGSGGGVYPNCTTTTDNSGTGVEMVATGPQLIVGHTDTLSQGYSIAAEGTTGSSAMPWFISDSTASTTSDPVILLNSAGNSVVRRNTLVSNGSIGMNAGEEHDTCPRSGYSNNLTVTNNTISAQYEPIYVSVSQSSLFQGNIANVGTQTVANPSPHHPAGMTFPQWAVDAGCTLVENSSSNTVQMNTFTINTPTSNNAGFDSSAAATYGVFFESSQDPNTVQYNVLFPTSSGTSISVQNNSGGTITQTGNQTTSSNSPLSVAPPIANAGPSQVVTSAASVTLSGSSSQLNGSLGVTYAWTQLSISGCSTVTINNASSATASFTAPTVTSSQICGFQLTATDTNGSSIDQVFVGVAPQM